MKKIFYTLLLISTITYSQELLRNPSFELNKGCPNNSGYTSQDKVLPWDSVHTAPDFEHVYLNSYYYNACDTETSNICTRFSTVPLNAYGNSSAHTGNAYIGLYTFNNYLEDNLKTRRLFVSQQLRSNLTSEAKYNVSMFVSFADNFNVFNNSLHVLFSPAFTFFLTDFIGGGAINLADFHPQVKFEDYGYQLNVVNGWQEIKGSFIADGSERFITIGNFKNNNESDTTTWGLGQPNGYCNHTWSHSFYFIDDVSLTLGIDAGKDTVICNSDNNSLALKASAGWQHYHWYLQGNNAGIDTGRGILIHTPGTYIVKGTVDSLPNYAKYDTIVVHPSNLSAAFYAAHATSDTTICKGSVAELRVVSGTNALHYEWSTGATEAGITVQDSGTYHVQIFENYCYKTDTIKVSYFNNNELLDSTVLHLTNLDNIITANSGFTQYLWSTGDTSQSVSISNVKFQMLNVKALSTDGCLVNDSVEIFMNELPIIIPNPQTAEEVFKVINLPTGSIVALYNSLGETIPLNKRPYPIAAGIYFYHIVLASGKELKGKIVVI